MWMSINGFTAAVAFCVVWLLLKLLSGFIFFGSFLSSSTADFRFPTAAKDVLSATAIWTVVEGGARGTSDEWLVFAPDPADGSQLDFVVELEKLFVDDDSCLVVAFWNRTTSTNRSPVSAICQKCTESLTMAEERLKLQWVYFMTAHIIHEFLESHKAFNDLSSHDRLSYQTSDQSTRWGQLWQKICNAPIIVTATTTIVIVRLRPIPEFTDTTDTNTLDLHPYRFRVPIPIPVVTLQPLRWMWFHANAWAPSTPALCVYVYCRRC